MQSANIAYLPRLDHLRFYAAFIVLVYHFALPQITELDNPLLLVFREGYGGVSLFMVLSGFILTSICQGREVEYRAFVVNRLLRLYPLYIVAVFVAAFGFGREVDPISFLALAFFLGNLGEVKLPHFPHLWTIMIEFQFYLVFPLLLVFIRRMGLAYVAGVLALLATIRMLVFLTEGSVQDAAYWTMIGRLDQFLLGMVLAMLHRQRATLLANPAWLVMSLLALQAWLMLFTWWCGGYHNADAPHSPSIAWVFSPLLEGMAYGFVALAYLHVRVPGALHRWGTQAGAVLAWLGTISFSIYVWHYPIVMLHAQMPVMGFLGRSWMIDLLVVILPAVVAVSALSHYVIERPFLSMRGRYLKGAPAPLPAARPQAYPSARAGLSSARP